MNQGTQLSLSGVLTSLHRQDVATNNLANINTVGFKTQLALTRQRNPVRAEDGVWSMPSDPMLERLNAGVLLEPSRTAFSQGPVMTTNQPFDVAIEGDGFFVVRDASDGATDRVRLDRDGRLSRATDRVRLSRDGRLTRNASGTLVQASTGLPVLDAQNRQITIGEGPFAIDEQGAIRQGGEVVANLAFVDVTDRDHLRREGNGLYLASANDLVGRVNATGRLRQGAIEGSSVNEITALMDVTSAARDVTANLGMVQYQDRLLERAINGLGRVG
ncbi:flagellar hook-basal body protein [Nodularia spumigena]|uniref:flagellar hook-basal body protein n=1 Tax=Nodularia spumigena TaxID=70799 RepID=UPI002B207837|nr:flagellar hook basal-body protein [Nodularia spumigena]MEA5557605.1 flagellar hook basal-body protein [Nodularia spumigena CH309]